MAIIADDYTRQLLALSPQGLAWPRELNTVFAKTMQAYADSLTRLHISADNLIDELDPRTTYHLIDEWERCYGLPDECTGQLKALELRRQQVLGKYLGIANQRHENYIQLAATIGYTVTIDEFDVFRCGISQLGYQHLNVAGSTYLYAINVKNTDKAVPFRCGTSLLFERLTDIKQAHSLECLFNRLKPAHIQLIFNYS